MTAAAPKRRRAHLGGSGQLGFGAMAALLTLTMVEVSLAAGNVALVVGNSAYEHVPDLPNPRNDASDVAATLRDLDFEVFEAFDVGRQAFQERLRAFDQAAFGAQMAMVFYAGHGMEMDKYNYLIPVDARLEHDRAVKHETIPLNLVVESVSGASGLGMVILDACRDNPFVTAMGRASATRSVGRGLAATDVAGGTLVHYAAREGTTADDGDGRNSPYTAALLRYLNEPGLEVGMLFRKVRDAVVASTNGRQEPFRYGSLPATPYYLNPRPLGPELTLPESQSSVFSAIAMLLDEAETNFAIDRLTRPSGDNAAARFRRVLSLDPANQAARRGLRRVAERYVVLIEAAIEDGAIKRARELASSLASVSPEHPRLPYFNQRITRGEIAVESIGRPAAAPHDEATKPVESNMVVFDDQDRLWRTVKDDCGRDANGEPGAGPSRYLRTHPGGRYESQALAKLLACRVAR